MRAGSRCRSTNSPRSSRLTPRAASLTPSSRHARTTSPTRSELGVKEKAPAGPAEAFVRSGEKVAQLAPDPAELVAQAELKAVPIRLDQPIFSREGRHGDVSGAFELVVPVFETGNPVADQPEIEAASNVPPVVASIAGVKQSSSRDRSRVACHLRRCPATADEGHVLTGPAPNVTEAPADGPQIIERRLAPENGIGA